MKKSGLADSPFFAPAQSKVETTPLPESDRETTAETISESPSSKQTGKQAHGDMGKSDSNKSKLEAKPISDIDDGMNKSLHASNNASMHASNQPFNHDTIIEIIRKAVKDVGKDSATYRFTPEEKKALLELSFSYKMQGYKTSENELTRIAINFLLEDHKQNGQNSILRRVLDALNQ